MGLTRTDIFTEHQNQIASYAKVLGHPARIAILQHIASQKECVCGDLVNEIGLAQATISQHLRELKSIGIIKGTIEGNSVCYCIHQEVWTSIKSNLESFFNFEIHCGEGCC